MITVYNKTKQFCIYNTFYARCVNVYFLLMSLSFSPFSGPSFKFEPILWVFLWQGLLVFTTCLLFHCCCLHSHLLCVIIFLKSLQMESYLFSGSLSSSSSSTVTGTDLDKASSPWGKKSVLKISFIYK